MEALCRRAPEVASVGRVPEGWMIFDKKNIDASKPSEHRPIKGEICQNV